MIKRKRAFERRGADAKAFSASQKLQLTDLAQDVVTCTALYKARYGRCSGFASGRSLYLTLSAFGENGANGPLALS